MSPFRLRLLRLLAINLAIGIIAAALMFGGLIALSPQLRALIFADRFGPVAAGLLLFGLVVTFGSVAMGSAVMALGRKPRGRDGGKPRPAAVKVAAR